MVVNLYQKEFRCLCLAAQPPKTTTYFNFSNMDV